MLLKASGPVRVISDPELKFGQSGTPVVSFRGVTDQKRKNQATGEWEDDKVMFVRVVAFKSLAENIAASIQKGHTVVVSGSIHASEWETKEGEKRTTVEIIADEVGASLRWDSATVNKTERGQRPQSTDENPWKKDNQGNSDDKPPF